MVIDSCIKLWSFVESSASLQEISESETRGR